MRYLLFTIFIISCLSALCQSKFEGSWTDGKQSFEVYPLKNGIIQFEGGTLHEGGSMFYGQLLADLSMKILGRRPSDKHFPSYGKIGDILEYKKIQDFELLILYNKKGDVKGILQKHNNRLQEIVITNKINHQLSGKYQAIDPNSIVTFNTNQLTVEGLQLGGTYKFELEYDFPIDVITFGSTSYFFEKGFRKLFLFKSKMNEHDRFAKEEFVMQLVLLENMSIVETQLKGDYVFASTIPLIDGILHHYTNKELRLIRNEIFARYGYKFENDDLKAYFESKVWYRPISKDVASRLTELEKLNVQQIKNIESRRVKMEISDNH